MKGYKLERLLEDIPKPEVLFVRYIHDCLDYLGCSGRCTVSFGRIAGYVKRAFQDSNKNGEFGWNSMKPSQRTKYLVDALTFLEEESVIFFKKGCYRLVG